VFNILEIAIALYDQHYRSERVWWNIFNLKHINIRTFHLDCYFVWWLSCDIFMSFSILIINVKQSWCGLFCALIERLVESVKCYNLRASKWFIVYWSCKQLVNKDLWVKPARCVSYWGPDCAAFPIPQLTQIDLYVVIIMMYIKLKTSVWLVVKRTAGPLYVGLHVPIL